MTLMIRNNSVPNYCLGLINWKEWRNKQASRQQETTLPSRKSKSFVQTLLLHR